MNRNPSSFSDRGVLADPEDVRDDVPELGRGEPSEEHGGVRQDGLSRAAHLRLRTGRIEEIS